MPYKTTADHFKLFKKEFKKWVDIFGLKGWEVEYKHTPSGDSLAWMNADLVGRVATIGLAPVWERTKTTTHEIKKCAFHEASELLLYKMRSLAKYRYATLYEIDEENHNIIRTLEGVIFENLHNYKG